MNNSINLLKPRTPSNNSDPNILMKLLSGTKLKDQDLTFITPSKLNQPDNSDPKILIEHVLTGNELEELMIQEEQDLIQKFPTFVNSEGRQIYAFSDIHGDIHSLIILLRDLAKVIRNKNQTVSSDKLDYNLTKQLLIDINLNELEYDPTLNYEWIPDNNSYVVIIGDILDGNRKYNTSTNVPSQYDAIQVLKNGENTYPHEFPQIEIKILKFINAMNESAMKNNGRIFKLFGNHEMINIKEGGDIRYSFFNDFRLFNNYYKKEPRKTIFTLGKIGFEELMKDGCRCLLMIDNYIFVHGQINRTLNFDDCEKINLELNDTRDKTIWNNNIRLISGDEKSILWDRTYGKELDSMSDRKCLDFNLVVQNFFKNKINNNTINLYDKKFKIDDIKLVIGHCTQYQSSINDTNNISFTKIINTDGVSQTLMGDFKTGKFNPDENLIFGITMECENTDETHKIYKVDVGSSRGFDNYNDYKEILKSTNPIENEKRFLFSRTPQLLNLDLSINKLKPSKERIKIIRSKMKNTRIHQPRPIYEIGVSESNNEDLNFTGKEYYHKYLKYKHKYLELKK